MNRSMLSRYASSRFRILLLAALIGTMLLIVGKATAQVPGTNPSVGGVVVKKQNVLDLLAANIGPVSITIVLLSVVGVTLIIQGFIKARREVFMPTQSVNTIRELIEQKRFKELVDFTETDPSFVSQALNPALKRAPNFSAMKEAMETALGEQTAEQFRRIEYLNIIGNLGPLLGLLGTVIGMIDAFQALHAAEGQANPADLAYGISEALTNTMLGLMLAVPCLAAFGILRTMVDRLTVQGALEAEDLLLMIRPVEAPRAPMIVARAGAVPQPATPPGAPAPPGPRKPPLPAPLPTPE